MRSCPQGKKHSPGKWSDSRAHHHNGDSTEPRLPVLFSTTEHDTRPKKSGQHKPLVTRVPVLSSDLSGVSSEVRRTHSALLSDKFVPKKLELIPEEPKMVSWPHLAKRGSSNDPQLGKVMGPNPSLH